MKSSLMVEPPLGDGVQKGLLGCSDLIDATSIGLEPDPTSPRD
jgi:hypothetical protein